MSGKSKDGSINEQINKLKYRFNYQISETPKYKAIIDDDMNFDDIPVGANATQDNQSIPNNGGIPDVYLDEQGNEDEPDVVTAPSNAPVPETGNAPELEPITPEEEIPLEEPVAPEEELPIEEPIPDEGLPQEEPIPGDGLPQEDQTQDINKMQNEIIKHNIEAMKSLKDKLDDLESLNGQLNNELQTLNMKVKEVEEPTNVEKFMTKKEVSYPYYFNLNDFWDDNWFDKQRVVAEEKGIRELPDGTFIADFDDLPQNNSMDVDDSFNTIT